jgi:hypothetical protein
MKTPLIPLGVALAAAMAAIARFDARHDTLTVLALIGAASIAFLSAVWLIAHGRVGNRGALWVCLALALVCRAPLLPVEPTLSDDIYRYVWDGRLQAHGVNPYQAVPSDPSNAWLHTDVTRKLNHPALPTLYPPFAEWAFRAIAAVGQSVIVFKVIFLLLDLAVVALLLRWLMSMAWSPWLVLVYAWNPLVILEVAGSGHLDVIGALLVTIAFLALGSGVSWIAAIALVAAIEVKFAPIVLVPLFWKRIRVRDVVIAAVFGALLAIPFMDASLSLPIGALPTYLAKWRFNGTMYSLLESLYKTKAWVALPVLGGLAVAWWFRRRSGELAPSAWAWSLGVAIFLSPTIYPWYLLWMCPFLTVRATLPLLVWTQTSLLTYYVWHVSATGGGWTLPWWLTAIELGVPLAVWAWMIAARIRVDRLPSLANHPRPSK